MPNNQTDANALRDSMTREVTNDAYSISQQIFRGQEGDVSRVSNEQLDERYRQAFASEDRTYLMQEATRDPVQFLASMQRLGVSMPPGQEIQPEPPLPKAAKANVPLPKPPEQALQSTYPTAQEVPPPEVPPQSSVPPAAPMPLAPPAQPLAPAPPVQPPPGMIPAMAGGGVVTQPTIALIGEQGPEAVVPLNGAPGPAAVLQPTTYQPDPDLAAHLGGTPGPGAAPPTPSHDEISDYIRQAAIARGIDPDTALAVAMHEGTNPATGRFDSPAQEGVFPTGRSYWPFQLHYGGAGTPYAQYGSVAGMGNDFTAQTGWQPGDPRAWKDATNFALDQAVANPKGWALWYGSVPARVAPQQGLPKKRA